MLAMLIIHFIEATARSKLRVVIVGIITNDKVKTLSTALYPTVMPPKHPTIKMMIQINHDDLLLIERLLLKYLFLSSYCFYCKITVLVFRKK